MPTNHPTILAIDPGTKELGVAVLEGDHLVYFGVKTFKHRSPPHVLLAGVSRFIDLLIERYGPECLAIERTFLIHKEAVLLNVVAAEIKSTARERGLVVYEYDPAQIRSALSGQEKATKSVTSRLIADRFPELARYLLQPTRWEALYWAHMFDAVAVGLICLRNIDN